MSSGSGRNRPRSAGGFFVINARLLKITLNPKKFLIVSKTACRISLYYDIISHNGYLFNIILTVLYLSLNIFAVYFRQENHPSLYTINHSIDAGCQRASQMAGVFPLARGKR